jgi:hypothetical protein
VLSCSDQQVFTGGAYALTLRYWKGCTISAYHYNIVANMMLLTCATHLMSVTIVRDYWRYTWLAVLRVLVISAVFLVTGVLLTNQNATGLVLPTNEVLKFPTTLPTSDDKDSPLFLPAACFQEGSKYLTTTFETTFGSQEELRQSLLFSQPGNRIQGWPFYVVMLLCYGAAILVEAIRFVQKGNAKNPFGHRAALVKRLAKLTFYKPTSESPNARNKLSFHLTIVKVLFALYQIGGIGISAATVVLSGNYMIRLRSWARNSGWMEVDNDGRSAEDDATSFGQLVPIFLCLLTLFTFAQAIGGESNR